MRNSKGFILAIFMIIVSDQICAQEYSIPPQSNLEINVRAKVLGMVFIEDEWARAFSAGTELIFYHHLGVVADIVHMRWKHEREVPINGSYSEGYNEYWQKDARNYMAFELRYYPIYRGDWAWTPYINTYSKVGRRFLHTHELYPLDSKSEVYRLNSSFYDFGTSLGVRYEEGSFGADVNIGAAYRNELKNEDYFHENGSWSYASNIRHARWIPNIRFSFFLILKN